MSITLTPIDDAEEELSQTIQLRTGRMIRGLRVEMVRDKLFLWGTTHAYYYKQLASHAAQELPGAFHIYNHIDVM